MSHVEGDKVDSTTDSWGQLFAKEAPKMLCKALALLIGGLAMYLPSLFFGLGYVAVSSILGVA